MPNRVAGAPGLHQGAEVTRSTAWQAQQYFAAQDYETTNPAALTWDVGKQQVRLVQLGVNSTLAFPINAKRGATYIFVAKQDSTGSRTLSFTAQDAGLGSGTWKWPGGVAPTLTTTASKTDVLSFLFDGTHMLGSFTLNM
jgi:hypothetical protein